MNELELQSLLEKLEWEILASQGSITMGITTCSNRYYPQFQDQTDDLLPQIGIFYNRAMNCYYTSFGSQNTPCKRPYPFRGEGGVLKESYPEHWFAPRQLSAYTFIKEIKSPKSFTVFEPLLTSFPTTPPFTIYYIDFDEDDPPKLRIKHKIRIIEIIDDIWYADADYDLVITGIGNVPMIGFYRHPVDKYLENETPITDIELKVEIPGTRWSLRPDCYHPLKPLSAWAYAGVYGWTWGYPIPYPEYTFDWTRTINEEGDGIQYGYDTPRVFETHRLAFSRSENYWRHNGLAMMPVALQTAAADQIAICILNLVGVWYFQMNDEINGRRRLALYRRVWQ